MQFGKRNRHHPTIPYAIRFPSFPFRPPCPVKFTCDSAAYFTGACPVKPALVFACPVKPIFSFHRGFTGVSLVV